MSRSTAQVDDASTLRRSPNRAEFLLHTHRILDGHVVVPFERGDEVGELQAVRGGIDQVFEQRAAVGGGSARAVALIVNATAATNTNAGTGSWRCALVLITAFLPELP